MSDRIAASDRIALRGLRAFAHHGVLESERREGQEFGVDVVLELDLSAAAASDDLIRTVDYGALADRLVAALTADPVDLIETVAERLAAVVLAEPLVDAVEIELHKPHAPISWPFDDVSVRIRRERPGSAGPQRAVVALGANQGDPVATIREALQAIDRHPHLRVAAVSGLHRTKPVSTVEQDDFVNAVALLETELTPQEVLAALLGIEAMAGRLREVHHGPRILDLDLIAMGARSLDLPHLQLPHPRARERAFVLVPWAQVEPDAVLPDATGAPRPITELAALADDRDGIEQIAAPGGETR